MRITIDVAPETVTDVLRLTGERKKSPALAKAAVEYVARRKAEEFGRLLREGAFDYPSTNEEMLHGVRVYAHDRHFDAMAPVLGLQLYKPGYGGRYVP